MLIRFNKLFVLSFGLFVSINLDSLIHSNRKVGTLSVFIRGWIELS